VKHFLHVGRSLSFRTVAYVQVCRWMRIWLSESSIMNFPGSHTGRWKARSDYCGMASSRHPPLTIVWWPNGGAVPIRWRSLYTSAVIFCGTVPTDDHAFTKIIVNGVQRMAESRFRRAASRSCWRIMLGWVFASQNWMAMRHFGASDLSRRLRLLANLGRTATSQSGSYGPQFFASSDDSAPPLPDAAPSDQADDDAGEPF